MNRTIVHLLTCAAFLLLTAGLAPLSAQSEEQLEKFKKDQETYFTEHLELSTSEAKAFWPLYNDFQNRKMKISEDEKNTISYAHKNAGNLTDKEIMETLDRIHKFKEEKLKLEAEYYQQKFLKALPPRKVLMLGKVEWDFRRHLMHELRGQGQGQAPGEKNRGGGSQGGDHEPLPMMHSPVDCL